MSATDDGTRHIDGRAIEVRNLDKVLFPDAGITKGELIEHHERLGRRILASVAGRPLTLARLPDGLDGEAWFQKQASNHFPDWIPRARLRRERGGTVEHVVADSPAVLVYLADQGTIELHAALATADRLDRPEEVVLDLDPHRDAGPEVARRATRRTRALLEELGLPIRLKTSGSAGFHLHVPLDGTVSQDTARMFARDAAQLLARRHPGELTIEHRKRSRGNRVFVDWLRNGTSQTVIVPYGVRARPAAPVATPMDLDELPGTDPQRWTLRSIPRRLAQRDDPWARAVTRTDLREARLRLAELAAG